MALSIKTATIRKDGRIEDIDIRDMTKELFFQIRDNVYCPNHNCSAKIEYAEGTKRTFFRTKRSKINGEEIIEQHVEDCPYSVEHENDLKTKGIYDSSTYALLSEKHIKDALKRAYKQYVNPDYGKKNNTGDVTKKGKSTISKRDSNIIAKGKATLIDPNGELGLDDKEPLLFHKKIDDISEKDIGQTRKVSGIMIDFVHETDYKYIVIQMKDGRKGRVLFGEYYRDNNGPQYSQIDIYETYMKLQNSNMREVYVVSVGEVTKDDYDVSIVMSKYYAIELDGKSHYDILRLMSKLEL